MKKYDFHDVATFRHMVERSGSDIRVRIDGDGTGETFLDLVGNGKTVLVLAWHPAHGFGFYVGEAGYGDRPSELIADPVAACLGAGEACPV